MNSGLGMDEPSASSTRWAHCDQLCSAIYELPPPREGLGRTHRDDLLAYPVGWDHAQFEAGSDGCGGHSAKLRQLRLVVWYVQRRVDQAAKMV